PVGAAAKGMPLKPTTSPCATPAISPASTFTLSPGAPRALPARQPSASTNVILFRRLIAVPLRFEMRVLYKKLVNRQWRPDSPFARRIDDEGILLMAPTLLHGRR